MTTNKIAESEDTPAAVAHGPEDGMSLRRRLGGSPSDNWNNTLVDQALQTLWVGRSDEAQRNRQVSATMVALIGIAPENELEAMMAAQLIAAHNATMECYRRAMIDGQTQEGRRENLNQANKLSRTWVMLLGALDKRRGKCQQKVTVEHVHIHAGGQAVVGNIERPGGGDGSKSEERPHAKSDP